MVKDNIIFTFSRNGKELILDETEYGIMDYTGIEATDYEIEKRINANHIGERMKRKRLLSRPISVEFDYLGPDEEKPEKRQELITFFSPFKAGMLTVNYLGTERSIMYEVSSFHTNSKQVSEMLSCLVELDCMDPAFMNTVEETEIISSWVGGWSFPFTFPIRFKQKGEKRQNILNKGHMETPVSITFRGPAKRPYVKNLATGEIIQIERELTSDETMYIDTAFGKKTVEIERNGVQEDATEFLTIESRFFWLEVGDNMIEYGSEDELQDNNVSIQYRERYLGV